MALQSLSLFSLLLFKTISAYSELMSGRSKSNSASVSLDRIASAHREIEIQLWVQVEVETLKSKIRVVLHSQHDLFIITRGARGVLM